MTIYYTADLHLGDARIIRLCERPYGSAKEMACDLRRRWNAAVTDSDTVYILGDLAFRYKGDLGEYVDSLNGKKNLIVGNHDRSWLKNADHRTRFGAIKDVLTIKDGKRSVALCHYPMLAFEGSTAFGYHIYGHIHNNYNEPMYDIIRSLPNSFNAGVDVNDFKPVTLDELIGRGSTIRASSL